MKLFEKNKSLNEGLLSNTPNFDDKNSPKADTKVQKKVDDSSIVPVTKEEKIIAELEDESATMSRVQMCRFFLKHSCRDIGRRKFHYCLAFMSVFIVVLSTLVIHTVVDKGPIILLALGQETVGAFDGTYEAHWAMSEDSEIGGQSISVNLNSQTANFINYTRVEELLGDTYNLSPRFHICDLDTSYAGAQSACLMALDFEREIEINLASIFPFKSLAKGECLISTASQKKNSLELGQTITMQMNEPDFWNTLLKYYFKDSDTNDEQPLSTPSQDLEDVETNSGPIGCKIVGFYDRSYGKFSQDQSNMPDAQIIVEVNHYLQMLATGIPKYYEDIAGFADWLQEDDKLSLQFVQLLMMTLPEPRHDYYQSSNYDDIQLNVLGYSNEIVQALGLYTVKANLELLGQMQIFQYQVMFIGLIFDVIVILFVIVAILLIYSLLLISVETKTFDIGIMRLVGLSTNSFVGMIFTQSFLFVAPSVIFGFICYVPVMVLVYNKLFTEELGFKPDYTPSRHAALQALILGIFIPAVSAIIPVKTAIAKTLADSLTMGRSKISGILITFTDNRNPSMAPYVLFGTLSVVYGTTIYYFMPKAMLELDLNLILQIFFLILLGMLFGLTILASNLQGLIGKLLTSLFLFWESSSTRSLLAKNVIAHQGRNRLTSNIYALTLGCIIFLITSANLQIESINQLSQFGDADIILTSSKPVQEGTQTLLTTITPEMIEKTIYKNQDTIKDFAYLTHEIKHQLAGKKTVNYIEDKAQSGVKEILKVYGISASKSMDKGLVSNYRSNEAIGETQQLYTARGDQGMICMKSLTEKLSVVIEDDSFDSLVRWHYTSSDDQLIGRKESFQLKRPLVTLKSKPAFAANESFMLVSMPQYSFLTQTDIEDVAVKNALIWVDGADRELIDQIADEFEKELPEDVEVTKAYVDQENNEGTLQIIDIIFYVTIGIMMFLCFFSLVASMTANLYDQSKEIGVMRSIGITKGTIKRIYFYEALILVLSSCLLGVFIGMTVGYTMALQQNMFMGSALEAFFPWKQVLQITVLSLLCAFGSTWGPASQVLKRQIAQILRS